MKPKIILGTIFTFFLTTSISFGYKAIFTPSIQVKGEYTDNILLTENSDLKKDDIITTVSPSFTADLIGKKGEAKFSYIPSYAFYDEFSEFNGWRHNANLSGRYNLAEKTLFDIRDDFWHTEDPVRDENLAIVRTEDPTAVVDNTVRKTREIYTGNNVRASLKQQFGKYNSFIVGYGHYFLNNDDPDIEDKQAHNPSARLTYWFGPKWGFDVSANYLRGEFDVSDDVDAYSGTVRLQKRFGKQFFGYVGYTQTVANYEGTTEDTKIYNPSIGFNYDIEKDISIAFDAGYFYSEFETSDSESGATGDIRLIKRFERGKINLSALGGADYSYLDSEQSGFNVFYEGAFSGTYQIAKYLDGNISTSYRTSDYTDSDRKDDTITAGVGLGWLALEWMKLGLEYRYRSFDSTVDADDYDENRVSVNITLVPTVPFHTSRY
jgi:Putative beta-barrel porin 2